MTTKIVDNITKLIGRTPMVSLNRIGDGLLVSISAKLESFNPCSSIKDRIALSMINDAEKSGLLKKGGTIIEPTSGNTGIALAFISAARGYKLILSMPETMSVERRALLKALGAELILTPGPDGMPGAIRKAEQLNEANPGSFMPNQFGNPANPYIHKTTTGPEIWDDSGGEIDILIAGVGTGGTITGAGGFLKEKNPEIKLIAVEPEASPFLSKGEKGPHPIQGIGAGFKPDILNLDIIDEIVTVSNDDAINTTRRMVREEGIPCGISSGANIAVAIRVASRSENIGKSIVTFVCDTGERYLSTPTYSEI